MRADIRDIEKNGYKFVMEFDTGGANGGDYTCWIYYHGKPLLKANNYQVRKDFGTKFNPYHFKRFVDKFISDEEYRNKMMEV